MIGIKDIFQSHLLLTIPWEGIEVITPSMATPHYTEDDVWLMLKADDKN